jgi:hypothetical protein
MIRPVAHEALAQTEPQRFTFGRRKSCHVSTGRALLQGEWNPAVVERAEARLNREALFDDALESGTAPQRR